MLQQTTQGVIDHEEDENELETDKNEGDYDFVIDFD